MSKTSSAKYYQENKERLQKKANERRKRKRSNSDNIVLNVTKISENKKQKFI